MPEPIAVGDKILAEFRPRRVYHLKDGAVAMIGREGVFEAMWIIEPGEDYAGEWAMMIPLDWPIELGFWAPEGDLRLFR